MFYRNSTVEIRIRVYMYMYIQCVFQTLPTHQEVDKEDGHYDDEDNPDEEGHLWEGQLTPGTTALILVPEDGIVRPPTSHHHQFDEGQYRVSEWGGLWRYVYIMYMYVHAYIHCGCACIQCTCVHACTHVSSSRVGYKFTIICTSDSSGAYILCYVPTCGVRISFIYHKQPSMSK